MHGQMKIQIVVFHGDPQLSRRNLQGQLLADLSHQRGLQHLARLYLTTRKLSAILEITIPMQGGKNLIVIANDSGYYFNSLHKSPHILVNHSINTRYKLMLILPFTSKYYFVFSKLNWSSSKILLYIILAIYSVLFVGSNSFPLYRLTKFLGDVKLDSS